MLEEFLASDRFWTMVDTTFYLAGFVLVIASAIHIGRAYWKEQDDD